MARSTDKLYYKISEVSEMLGIPASTLRFWESEFPDVKPRRNDKGTRFYTPADVETLRQVNFLVKEKGLRLEAAKEEMRINRSGVSKRAEAIQTLKSVRNRLEDLLNSLHHLR